MSFISKILNRKNIDNPFLGDWFNDQTDEGARNSIGDVKMTFTKEGELIYIIREGNKSSIFKMIYSVDENILITDQPSHPQVEKTEYYFIDKKTLILKFNGVSSRFIKSS